MSKIYVAENSKILAKMICSALIEKGYETETFTDGYELLKAIVSAPPVLIIAEKELASINGIELCKILKTGSKSNTIPLILISTDDSVFDFWTTIRDANRVVLLTDEKIDNLITAVTELLSCNYVDANEFMDEDAAVISKQSDEKTLVSWAVNAMDKSEFFLNMSQNIIQLYKHVNDTEYLVIKLFRMLYTACPYDGIALVLDSQPAKVYVTGTEYFDVKVGDDFLNICKAEYEQQAKKNHSITYEEKFLENILLVKPDKNEYESYRAFTIKTGNDFVGTLHLASTKKGVFNYKVQSSIEFVLPAIANLLQESLVRAELVQQEKRLRSAFSKFVPEEVINDFLNSDGNQELKNQNEKRSVVILMCDIRSFTTISEANKPEDVVNFLNTYFTRMVEVVKKYGGTVDKFIGDAIMVLFGAPISYNDNEKRGIGIHSGDVILGQIGSTDKTSYTVIGDTVNLASRLEGLTKLYGTKIIISQAVRDALDESLNIRLLDSVKVKGKKEAVYIYRVDGHPLPEAFTDAYEKGFKSYNEGAFSLALPYFETAVNVLPEDRSARLMLERCEEFSVNKPENWDGAIALTSK